MIPTWILVTAIVVIGVGAFVGTRNQVADVEDVSKPTIWWHVDDLANAKRWRSFEDRRVAGAEPKEPYLSLTLRRARERWSGDFTIIPVYGRAEALQRIRDAGGAIPEWIAEASPLLWMMWVRVAGVAALGGLWLDGSVLPMATGAELRRRLAKYTASFRDGAWAMVPNHPAWVAAAAEMSAIVELGPQSWSEVELRRLQDATAAEAEAAELMKPGAVRLNYEDLFEKSAWWSPAGALWVALPDGRDRMEMASKTLWFTRLSEAQIMQSEFLWALYAKA